MAYEQTPLLDAPVLLGLRPTEITRSQRYAILASMWLATFLSSINMSLVPTMIPSISSDFNKSHQASWLGTGYLLATCTFTPLYGRLCNVMGRRGANYTAVFFALLGTVMCGLSNSMEMLIVARFLAGIGGGGVFTVSSIVVSDMYSLRNRGLAQGMQNVFNGLGMGMGGPIGGLITDWVGWRWAFLCQVPFFLLCFVLTSRNLIYVTEGKGKSPWDVLKRIDYAGSFTLLISVGSCLFFLSTKYNENMPWSDPAVIVPLVLSISAIILFVVVELYVAAEPVMAPFLLKQKIPVLVATSNFFVATCNFSITYFYPMWFQTVMLTSASVAGLHLLPNSISMSAGSLFAGWMMHKTGKYRLINLLFGIFPFIAGVSISMLREDSGPIKSWLSIIPLGFGNAVVLQTMLVALLAHIPESHMAVGTGFGQLFRGIGQVGGVAVSSAIFQSKLDTELRKRIHTPDAEELITKIRQSTRLIGTLPPDLQRIARDSYATSLRVVFVFAAVCTLTAYIVRLPIPEKDLDSRPPSEPVTGTQTSVLPTAISTNEDTDTSDDEGDDVPTRPVNFRTPKKMVRRLSTIARSVEHGGMDLESDTVGGSARNGNHV